MGREPEADRNISVRVKSAPTTISLFTHDRRSRFVICRAEAFHHVMCWRLTPINAVRLMPGSLGHDG